MAGINPIGGPGPIQPPAQAPGSAQSRPATPGKFTEALQNYLGEVNQSQQGATQAVEHLLSGRTDDVLPAVTAMAEADMSFKLLVGVRNKMIEAYKQTLNMQV
ncbi:MAG: flagellar hook-basal body complex protein FliE [Planctomycetota bacterium]